MIGMVLMRCCVGGKQVLKLLGDSSKDVRDAAITALEKFYMYIGASLLVGWNGS